MSDTGRVERILSDRRRLDVLRDSGVLDLPDEEAYDRLTRIAAQLTGAPVALASFISETSQLIKGQIGLAEPLASHREVPIAKSFCKHVIARAAPLLIEDAEREALACGVPTHDALQVAAYAGIPIRALGQPLGALCVIDESPRPWTPEQVDNLQGLAEALGALIELRLVKGDNAASAAHAREAHQRASQAGRLLRRTFDSAPVGVALADRSGRIFDANTALCELLGQSRTGLEAHTLWSLVRADARDDALSLFRSVLSGREEVGRREFSFLLRDGSVVQAGVSAALVRDAAGEPAHVVMQFEDVTERRRIARAKDELVSVVGHEVRTPLTAILAVLEMLTEDGSALDPETRDRIIRLALTNARQLAGLVDNFLDLRSLDAGEMPLRHDPCPADAVIARAVSAAGADIERSGADLNVGDCRVTALGDPDRIVQVLVNLIGNAAKFSPAGGRIDVGAVERDGRAVFHVDDEGRGIAPEHRDGIFERFEQVDASDSRAIGGAGLGLALCREIAHKLGGELGVESELGRGSRFLLALPLAPDTAARDTAVQDAAPRGDAGSPATA